MKTNFLLITFLCNFFCCFSQTQGEFIVEIDRTTGTLVKTGPLISGITYVYPMMRAYDENTGTFIFPSADVPTRLYSIDVTNDAIVHNPAYNNQLAEFEFCNSTGTLYGLLKDNTNDVKYLAVINQVTGASTTVGAAITGSSTYQGFSTFDQVNNHYIFLDPANKIYTLDATNGNIISNPNVTLPANHQLATICFNETTNTLYGITINSLTSTCYFASINASTGIVTTIGGGLTNFTTAGSSAIDLMNQQFIYLYYESGAYRIATINISTGAVIQNNLVTPLDGVDNVASLKYDNVLEKLYCIHWDHNIPPLTIHSTDAIYKITLSPNPFSLHTTLQTSQVLNNATLIVYNALGEQMMQIQNINGQTVTINRNDFPAGIYYMELSQSNELIAAEKLIVTDN